MVDALTPPRIAARGLVVRRGGRTTLDIPELDLRRGEVLALIGPNGAGKTTLLLHLALLERAAEGEILYDGASVRGQELRLRRRMAVVFQEPLLLERSAGANVELGLRLRGVPAQERRERSMHWMAAFGVAQLAGRSPRTLSGGESQRVSLARAFALEPEVLMLDEPFSSLDAPTREALVGDLAAALRETSATCLLVTHDRDEAARLGDRMAVLIGGTVRQCAPPEQVFGAPRDEDVAAFVGIETVIAGTVLNADGGLLQLQAGAHTIEAVGDPALRSALICLRPEDISIGLRGGDTHDSARNHLPGTVRRIVRSGADARVEIDCGFTVIARLTRRSVDELGLAEGTPVVASFKATAVHLIAR